MIAVTYVVHLLGYIGIVVGLVMLVLSGPRREGPAYCLLKDLHKHRPLSSADVSTPYRRQIGPQ